MVNKYFTNKKGNKITVRDSETGRIKKWLDVTDLDRPSGQFKVIEYVLHFKPTRESNKFTPSSFRDWEVRIRVPEGYDEDNVEGLARKALEDRTNENMVSDSTMTWNKRGIDTIGFSDEESYNYKIVDTVRPQYKYPKDGTWGNCDEDFEKE